MILENRIISGRVPKIVIILIFLFISYHYYFSFLLQYLYKIMFKSNKIFICSIFKRSVL